MKRILFNLIYNKILSNNIILPFKKNIRYIFLFHDLSPVSAIHHNDVYSTDLEVFKNNVEWIRNHFKMVTIDQITNPDYLDHYPSNLASIVFDDGFHSVLEYGFPFLKSLNIPFAVFANQAAIQENWLWCSNILMAVNQKNNNYLQQIYGNYMDEHNLSYDDFLKDPLGSLNNSSKLKDDYSSFRDGSIEKQKVYLDESDIKYLYSEGVVIGNHTKTHKHLSTCSTHIIVEEIIENKQYLQNLLGTEIKHFAIPFGFHTTYNEFALKAMQANHEFIYGTMKDRLKGAVQSLIPRIGLRSETKSEIISYVNYPLLRNIS